MNPKDLQKDMYIRWKTDRIFNNWDVYGKIIGLSETEVVVLSFDDFKETTIPRNGEAVRKEFMVTTKEAVTEYLNVRKLKLKSVIAEMEFKHNNDKQKIDSVLRKIDSIQL